MRPFSVVENEGFGDLLKVLKPRYDMPSRAHFSQNVLPKLLKETKSRVEEELRSTEAPSQSPRDGWTSPATDSYLTITAHYITDHWQIANPFLQTRPVFESHTSEHLSEILTQAMSDWKITRSDVPIPVTTDNARNVAMQCKKQQMLL